MTSPASHFPLVFSLGIGLLIAWRLYARIRRFVGRQQFRPRRARFSVVFFPVLLLLLLAGSVHQPERALPELVGVAIGIALAVYGLRLTKFEDTPTGLYYTPSAHIGIALSLLLVARVAYRLVQVYLSSSSIVGPPVASLHSPLTLLVLGTLGAYYAWYALGLLRRYGSPGPAAPLPPPGAGGI